MARASKHCIFCGSQPTTREHVWADWLKQYIPKTSVNYSYLSATSHKTHTEYTRKTVGGDLRSRRLQVVCQPCNNGWMSLLQERAKPLLLPLLKGEITVFDVNQQQVLAAWISMFVMVAEHFDPNKVVSPLPERQILMNEKRTPPNWNIWFGDLDQNSDWPALLNHFAVPISTPEHIPEIMSNGFPRPNTQTMTFRVGRLYVHVRSSVTDIFENWRFARPNLLAQIWPIRRNLIAWPPRIALSGRDADAICASFKVASDEVENRTVNNGI